MPFPDAKRILFKKNPLVEVVCQLRFPPILRIDAEIPAAFQERIRDQFPNYCKVPSVKITAPIDVPEGVPVELLKQLELMKQTAQSHDYRNHEFSSEDGQWKITLSRTFIALTAKKYERWEKFNEKLNKPLEALFEIYSPSYFTRIGLRYIDVISRSDLNLKGVAWSDLLKPFLLGLLSTSEIRDSVRNYQSTYEIALDDQESAVRLIASLGDKVDTGEQSFVIDSDFFIAKRTEIKDAVEKLRYFNMRASRLIQWCMTEKLYRALEPQTL